MPDPFIEADPTRTLNLKLEANPTSTDVPRYGFTCSSCGVDTTNPATILSNSTQELRLAWIQHLEIIHGLSAPKGPCNYVVSALTSIGTLIIANCLLLMDHPEDHLLSIPRTSNV